MGSTNCPITRDKGIMLIIVIQIKNIKSSNLRIMFNSNEEMNEETIISKSNNNLISTQSFDKSLQITEV